MKRKYLYISILTLGILNSAILPQPSWAERPRAVKQVIKDTADAEKLHQESAQQAHKAVNDYLYKSKQLDKMDNDVRYLLNKASGMTGKELCKYLQTYVAPKNAEALSKASTLTSPSPSIRELNSYFMEYIRARGAVISQIIELSRYKVPAIYMREAVSMSSCGFQAGGVSVFGIGAAGASAWDKKMSSFKEYARDEQVPYEVHQRLARLQSNINDLYTMYNKYLNKRDYIVRHQEDIIMED